MSLLLLAVIFAFTGNAQFAFADSNEAASGSSYSAAQGSLSVGFLHACAVSSVGGMKCWGNYNGRVIGDGVAGDGERATPVDVFGLTSGVASIAAKDSATCALTTSGGVKCWGQGIPLYDSTYDSNVPVDVAGYTTGVAQISVGTNACMVLVSSALHCWGANNWGGIGDGTQTARTTPVEIFASGISAVSAGEAELTCAVTTAGGVKCWGYNGSNLFSSSTDVSIPTPTDIPGLSSGVKAITVGAYHACAITSSDGVKCWGWGSGGQLGNGLSYGSTTPVDVTGLNSGVIAISAHGVDTCALLSDGSVKCWGDNRYGQLGDGTTQPSNTPQTVQGLSGTITGISVGVYSAMAVNSNGDLYTWGVGYLSGTGRGNSGTPTLVTGFTGVQVTPTTTTTSTTSTTVPPTTIPPTTVPPTTALSTTTTVRRTTTTIPCTTIPRSTTTVPRSSTTSVPRSTTTTIAKRRRG